MPPEKAKQIVDGIIRSKMGYERELIAYQPTPAIEALIAAGA